LGQDHPLKGYSFNLSSLSDLSFSLPSLGLSTVTTSLGSLVPYFDIDTKDKGGKCFHRSSNYDRDPPMHAAIINTNVVTRPTSPVPGKPRMRGNGLIEITEDQPLVIFRSSSESSWDEELLLVEETKTSGGKTTCKMSSKSSALTSPVIDTNGCRSPIKPTDIMSGRGSGIYESPGNVLMRKVVETYVESYKKIPGTHRTEKTKVAKQIVMELQQEHGARFLQKQGGCWVVASDKFAREKISRALREDYGNTERYKMKRLKHKKV
jgi:hypothetical protein